MFGFKHLKSLFGNGLVVVMGFVAKFFGTICFIVWFGVFGGREILKSFWKQVSIFYGGERGYY